jgi:hypothetical protein
MRFVILAMSPDQVLLLTRQRPELFLRRTLPPRALGGALCGVARGREGEGVVVCDGHGCVGGCPSE